MKKLHFRRIKLDFNDSDSTTIELNEIRKSEKANLVKTYPNHSITQLDEMTTISEGYLIIAFSINGKQKISGLDNLY